MTRTWYLAMVIVDDKINDGINIFLPRWLIRWPWQSTSAIQSASPNAACPGLLWKPLDAGIGQLLAPYCPSGHQVIRQTNNNQQIHLQRWPFDGHGNVPVRNGAHPPLEEVQGFTRRHWMPPSGKYNVG
jgi:hypothetical protein